MATQDGTVQKRSLRRRGGDLATRIEAQVDLMLEAITGKPLDTAPVGQLASAIVTLTEKVRAMRANDAPSPEMLAEVIKRHVKDRDSIRSIVRDLREISGRGEHGGARGGWERPRNADGTFRGGGGVEGVGSE